MDLKKLASHVRSIPDFPKKGIIFRDITTVLQNAEAFKTAIDLIVEKYKDARADKVVAVDARGFLFGGAVAYKLNAGLVPVRKKGKLPWKTTSVTYELEYGVDTLEIHRDALSEGERVIIVDDLLATGGTVGGVVKLTEQFKVNIVGISFLIELVDLKGREKLEKYPVHSLIEFEGE